MRLLRLLLCSLLPMLLAAVPSQAQTPDDLCHRPKWDVIEDLPAAV